MKNWTTWAAFLLIFTVIGCGKADEAPSTEKPPEEHALEAEADPKSAGGIELSKAAIRENGIETTAARIMPMQSELKVAGTVTSNAKGRAIVTSSVSGKIVRLLVSQGEKVAQGQSLAVIESPDLAQAASLVAETDRARLATEADIAKASAELDLAKGRLRTAQEQLQRQFALAKAGAFSQPSLQAAKNETNAAQSDLDSAKADEAVHKEQLERAERLFAQELIARTDLEQARLALSQDQLRRSRAEVRVGIAADALKREEEIARKGLLTAREVQAAEGEARAANLEVQRGKIELESARATLTGVRKAIENARANYSAVRGLGNGGEGSTMILAAPIAGTVTERKATIGQAVERSSELFEIENLDTVWVTANVPEKDVAAVERGLGVRITAAAYPSRTFLGIVQLLGNHLDAKTRTIPVECLVENKGGLLREDMFATVLVGVGRVTKALVIPDSAIDHHPNEDHVFVENGDRYERRAIKVGRAAGGYTEVVSGLNKGERVVTKGLFILESESRKEELKGED